MLKCIFKKIMLLLNNHGSRLPPKHFNLSALSMVNFLAKLYGFDYIQNLHHSYVFQGFTSRVFILWSQYIIAVITPYCMIAVVVNCNISRCSLLTRQYLTVCLAQFKWKIASALHYNRTNGSRQLCSFFRLGSQFWCPLTLSSLLNTLKLQIQHSWISFIWKFQMKICSKR